MYALKASSLLIALIGLTMVPLKLVAESFSEYRLNAGDRISIRVYGENDLNHEAMLGDSGNITYPFLGEIRVVDLTPEQLEAIIVKGLKGDYLINPSVTVTITQYRPVFIYGEVQAPGGYSYQPGLTVGKATALAQGITERGSESRIYLIREGGSEEERTRVDMSTKLRPGDVVTIEQGFF
ncbi:polysaccharide biosynthesis/export family protein [uncultured Microbulbifer sp.]|uniref:polysaccharide biosynthesis/export family protein n=1 Tax=uncultured Microbulbifer sp. TaxID=348147 RepID=UPI00261128DF|nr:polysaccharide biosynthesis/export family protein [uncultured Microbulbifer sp.]